MANYMQDGTRRAIYFSYSLLNFLDFVGFISYYLLMMDGISDEQIELLLRQQVYRLDMAFRDFVALDLSRQQAQIEMNTALRAQAQCRATAFTLQRFQKQKADEGPVT